jgi:hypothetical protein
MDLTSLNSRAELFESCVDRLKKELPKYLNTLQGLHTNSSPSIPSIISLRLFGLPVDTFSNERIKSTETFFSLSPSS